MLASPESRQSAVAVPPPLPDPARTALFLDVDGTLAELRDQPSQVIVPASTVAVLGRLHAALRGAVVILSGRAGDSIDALLRPLALPYGANHGAERRDLAGHIHRIDAPPGLSEALAALRRGAADWNGVLIEPKPLGVAVHYRMAPDRGEDVRSLVRDVAARHAGQFDVQPGKMVFELKPHGVDKGAALREFMQGTALAERIPVMAGDDLTDESAFVAAQAAGGYGIKIGAGDSVAPWRLSGPADLARWLCALCAKSGQ
ncbi:Trehalose-phosphate phosphatase [Bordetella ansorpii]|uniref:Trehalose 6-phosphate phosphatase n=1 Tax=Bordetella ansorpii TaxID=288768 RepID=A0A157S4D8_9BORD|nr:trehalose-phosphatase [Bordetella ansorpii]SAI65308.1 Trehalose-phosphate phosphatase [Bordetella ansorpii]